MGLLISGHAIHNKPTQNSIATQESSGRLEFDPDAADTLECLLKELPAAGEGVLLSEVLPGITKGGVAVAQRLHQAGILVVK